MVILQKDPSHDNDIPLLTVEAAQITLQNLTFEGRSSAHQDYGEPCLKVEATELLMIRCALFGGLEINCCCGGPIDLQDCSIQQALCGIWIQSCSYNRLSVRFAESQINDNVEAGVSILGNGIVVALVDCRMMNNGSGWLSLDGPGSEVHLRGVLAEDGKYSDDTHVDGDIILHGDGNCIGVLANQATTFENVQSTQKGTGLYYLV